jgi:hypothetical protein
MFAICSYRSGLLAWVDTLWQEPVTYKMALAQCLINYASKNIEELTLDELAEDFFDIYVGRIRSGARKY